MKVDVILPAGGRIEGAFAAEAGVEIKALIQLGHSSIIERTVAALRATGQIARIVAIGPEELRGHLESCDVQAVLPEGASGPDNFFRGLEWLVANGGAGRPALIIGTDLPFIGAPAVSQFLADCPPATDLCAPILRKEEFEARYPGLGGEYVRLRDGHWTMGCAFLVNPEAVLGTKAHIDRIFAARKNQLAMVRLLGFLFVARFATGRLSVAHIQRRCEGLLGCSGTAVAGCPPELAFDIDGVEDYRYALRHWNEMA